MKISEIKEAIAKYLLKMSIRENPLILRGPNKGTSYLDAGFVYAPYVPFQITQTFLTNEARPDAPLTVKEIRRLIAVILKNREFENPTAAPSHEFYGKFVVI